MLLISRQLFQKNFNSISIFHYSFNSCQLPFYSSALSFPSKLPIPSLNSIFYPGRVTSIFSVPLIKLPFPPKLPFHLFIPHISVIIHSFLFPTLFHPNIHSKLLFQLLFMFHSFLFQKLCHHIFNSISLFLITFNTCQLSCHSFLCPVLLL